ncbi:hypothetical protein [Saccharothrix longispora]|uniref:hypothetical protein n=1 Tax=Saccharothrix longispora TaxID=33920 RepID=UPI0028FDB53B|nr:hypothetical protein [Saccharothrix longispora]MBY8847930.1 hypothetical protein [Saccharothrix sp. MB29]MDU0288673.1 hypothetical protein [Saccharothrix longispora]
MNDAWKTGTEELLRDALELRAERTPPPGPVLAALHRPRRPRKPLFLVLATAATAAAATVAITTVTTRPVAETAPPAISATSTSAPAPAVRTVSLEYSPTWMPPGFAERLRSYAAYSVERGYEGPGGSTQAITFGVRFQDVELLTDRMAEAAPADRTTVRGAPAFYFGDLLYWQPEPTRFLSLSPQGVADPRAVVKQIAESTVRDDRPVPVPVSVKGSTEFSLHGTGPDRWTAQAGGEHRGRSYAVHLGSDDGQVGEPRRTTALGRPASFYPERGVLVVELRPAQYLVVQRARGAPDDLGAEEELVEVAGQVTTDPDPRVDWFARW